MTDTTRAARCLAQADLLLMLSQVLEPPERWSAEDRALGDPDARALAAAAGLAARPGGTTRLLDTARAWRDVDPAETTGEFARLFDGNVACPCNETAYIRRDKGALLADIAGFYRAFGFELSDGVREKHDHIVAELQFIALLSVLRGRALDAGHTEHEEITRDALTGFLNDHLGAWLPLFAARLESVARGSLHPAVSRLARAVWDLLKASYQLRDDPAAELPVLDETGSPYECGLCEPSEPA